MKKREPFPDIVRGFAIILVCFGHCIQMGSGEQFFTAACYFDSRMYQFIYSFHMPLFMVISGFFAAFSMQKAEQRHTGGRLLAGRAFTLLFPVLFWTLFETVVNLIRTLLTVSPDDPVYGAKAAYLVRYFAGQIPENLLGELWFLWAVWWSFLAVWVIRHLFHDSRIAYAVLAVAGLVTPDGYNFGVYKYVFPFFLLGYLSAGPGRLHSYWTRIGLLAGRKEGLKADGGNGEQKVPIAAVVTAGAAFLLLFVFFRRSFLIYQSGFRVIPEAGVTGAVRTVVKDGYRFVIGCAGSLFFLLLFRWWYDGSSRKGTQTDKRDALPWRILEDLGRKSMGIYILSTYWIVWLIKPLADPYQLSYGWNLLETVAVVLLSWGLTSVLGRIPLLWRAVGCSSRILR